MCNFKHITPCLSHNFPQVHSKQSTTSRIFNLWTFLTMQLLTYKDVSVCKLSNMRTCLFATCHLISHVLSRLRRFHTNVSPTRRVLAHVRTLQGECLHTFWLTKTCLCVTFNIWHHLFHLTTHICSRNDVTPLDFNLRTLLCIQLLTYETMSEKIGFTDSKDSVHCEKTSLYTTFWLTRMCSHEDVLIEARVCIQLVTQFPMLCSIDMFPRSVYYETYSCACSHTKKRVSVHFFDLRSHAYA